MAEYAVISCSLRTGSRSRLLAQQVMQEFAALGADAAFLDMREHPLPLCDAEAAYDHPEVAPVEEIIRAARVVILAVPVYNFAGNAVAKNLLELTGDAWEDKIVGFVCAAGGDSSYMSVLSLANSLMLDFRCVILPRFVYATGAHFEDDVIAHVEVKRRIAQLAQAAMRLRVTSPAA